MLALHARVPLTYRLSGPVLHLPHRLPAGERGGRRVLLHDLHQRLVGQLGELAAGPVPVVALADAVLGAQGQFRPRGEQRRDGLPAALQRAGDDLGEGQVRKPLGQPRGLRGAALVERHTGRPPGEHSRGIGGGTSVPDKDQRGHVPHPRHTTTCGSAGYWEEFTS